MQASSVWEESGDFLIDRLNNIDMLVGNFDFQGEDIKYNKKFSIS